MDDIAVVTSTGRLRITREDASHLLQWIHQTPGAFAPQSVDSIEAALRDGGEVKWDENGKQGAIHAVGLWILVGGADAVPKSVLYLKSELMRDLGMPPFDDISR